MWLPDFGVTRRLRGLGLRALRASCPSDRSAFVCPFPSAWPVTASPKLGAEQSPPCTGLPRRGETDDKRTRVSSTTPEVECAGRWRSVIGTVGLCADTPSPTTSCTTPASRAESASSDILAMADTRAPAAQARCYAPATTSRHPAAVIGRHGRSSRQFSTPGYATTASNRVVADGIRSSAPGPAPSSAPAASSLPGLVPRSRSCSAGPTPWKPSEPGSAGQSSSRTRKLRAPQSVSAAASTSSRRRSEVRTARRSTVPEICPKGQSRETATSTATSGSSATSPPTRPPHPATRPRSGAPRWTCCGTWSTRSTTTG